MKDLLKNKTIQFFLVFIISFSFLLSLQLQATGFLCPDSYYHIKCAQLIKSGGIIKNFPWLKFTTLADNQYVDPHLLFHFYLIPFLTLGKIIGPKIANSLSASCIFVLFFLLLDFQKIKAKLFWTSVLLFGCYPFIVRLSLIRAQNLFLILLVLVLIFLFKNKYFWLGIVAFFSTFVFSGFILLLFIVLIYTLISYAKNRKVLLAFFATLLGQILGVIINPYFPKNISFLVVQLRRIIFFLDIPRGGAEWYPISFSILDFLIPFLLFILSISLLAIRLVKKQEIYFLGIVSSILLIATIFFQRFIEYFIPLSIIFSAFSIDYYFKRLKEKQSPIYLKAKSLFYFLRKKITKESFKLLIKNRAFVLALFIFIFSFFILNVQKSTKTMLFSPPYDRYKKASTWLAQNTPKGAVVFNINWDDFPQLFFWNQHNYYVAGLDPIFSYFYNKDLWEKYKTIEENLDKAAQIIKQDFSSRYLFLSKKNENLAEKLDKRKDFKKIYQDNYSYIYEIK